jgi:hypothetical protein
MAEKVKMEIEEHKIAKNKNLTFVDKVDAMKSARSLSRTIEGLIDREKGKLSEYYDSHMRQTDRSTSNNLFGKSVKQGSIDTNSQFNGEFHSIEVNTHNKVGNIF